MLGLIDLFQFSRLDFVKKEKQSGDIVCFYFKPNRTIKHTAGQHGAFFLPNFMGMHIFSLASSPNEEYVMIATHIRKASRYKQRLNNLKKGDSMWMMGPGLNFVLRANAKHHVFLSQGIGITPFRSILVWAKDKELDIRLIHVDKGNHTFRSLTSSLASKAMFPTTKNEFEKLAKQETEQSQNMFYLSGSIGFIKSTKKLLKQNGVSGSRIKSDSFFGY